MSFELRVRERIISDWVGDSVIARMSVEPCIQAHQTRSRIYLRRVTSENATHLSDSSSPTLADTSN